LKALAYGVAVNSRKYNAEGRLVDEIYYDEDLNKTRHNNNYVRVTQTYNAKGNVESQSYYDSKNQPVLAKIGCAKVELDYDNDQNMSKEKCFGVDGNLFNNVRGVAETILHFDELGNVSKVSVFDALGSPDIYGYGYASIAFNYDKNGNVSEEAYFDINNEPMALVYNHEKPLLSNNVFKTLSKYDARGNLSESTFQGKNGNFSTLNGVAKYKYKYDKLGHLVEESHYDVHEKPVVNEELGYFMKVTVYANGSNIIQSEDYYDDHKQILDLF
jgi:YD repeat-containing protein